MASFSEWLAARDLDEAKMDRTRRDQLFSFWQQEQAADPPPVGKDSTGADVKVGDMVTMTFTVGGAHAVPEGGVSLNLDLDGKHYLSCPSRLVKKA